MFRKNDLGEFEARVGGMMFVCDELPPDAEAMVEAFAARYQNGGYAALCDYLVEEGDGGFFPRPHPSPGMSKTRSSIPSYSATRMLSSSRRWSA